MQFTAAIVATRFSSSTTKHHYPKNSHNTTSDRSVIRRIEQHDTESKAQNEEIMQIRHIAELFTLDGTEFLTEAYRNLLRRDPDPQGLRHYQGRLAMGDTKAEILCQLAASKEYKETGEIAGLEALLRTERRARHWLWSRFGHRQHHDRLARELRHLNFTLLSKLARAREIDGTSLADSSTLDSSAAKAAPKESCHASNPIPALLPTDVRAAYLTILGREPESDQVLAHHLNHKSIEDLYTALIDSEECRERTIAPGSDTTVAAPSRAHSPPFHLSPVDVRQAYREVLGREPENAAAISHHMRAESANALRQTLMNSEEFRAPLRALPTHARRIFFRIHQVHEEA